jgi:serine/threonine protein kinase
LNTLSNVLINFVHRSKDSRIPPELVNRYIDQIKADIAKNKVFDAAEAVDTQKRTLLTIAEGYDANSRLSKAVRKMILFLELYKIKRDVPPAHKSKTCIVPLAEDYSDASAILPEALKFMRKKDQFERELTVREGLDERFVIGVIRYYDSTTDPVFAAAIKSFHNGVYAEYPYCIVLPRANRGIHEVITHDHIAGVPDRISTVKDIAEQVAKALQHFHEEGIIHAVSADILQSRVRSNPLPVLSAPVPSFVSLRSLGDFNNRI